MAVPNPNDPWLGLSPDKLRFLEAHQARAVAIPGRGWRDLGDSVMLYSASERDPFFNRLVAVRWPSEPEAFDARLREACQLFDSLGRWPHVWAIPGLSEPEDLVARLVARGFVDQGGGYDMVLVREPAISKPAALPSGTVLHRWNGSAREQIPGRAAALASVIAEAFDIPSFRRSSLEREISLTLEGPDFHAYLITAAGEPVATGQRFTFDGASYLSSIGTRKAWQGRGLGREITRQLAADSLAEGVEIVYLGVYADNARAIGLYERLGFARLGGKSADMLLSGQT
jgi:ribosomal protein S18 acetylase RimI-like enzyme